MNKGWQTVPLGEVLSQNREYIDAPEARIYPKLSVKLYGKGVVMDAPADGTSLKMQRHQIAKSGQVILSEIWGKRGAIGFVPPEGEGALCTSHFFLFDVLHYRLDPRYLQAVFTANYLQAQLDAGAKGTTGYAAVRPKDLMAATIPLPPLPEQRRLVARIEALAEKIAEARGLRKAAGEEVEALLAQALAFAFDAKMLDCDTQPLGEICRTTSGGTPSRERADFYSGTIPWIKSGELEDKIIHHAEEHVTQSALDNSSAKLFPCGTLVVALYGATVGKTGILGLDAATNQAVCAIFPNSLLMRDFAWWFFKRMRPAYLGMSFGGAQPNISQKVIRETIIPVPSLNTQKQIVAYLDSLQAQVDAVKQLQAQTAAELDALLPSVLDKAFRGEL